MRQVTVTEKYRAVNEGQMDKQEFVRQMRLAFPSLINQFNGYDDSVSILRTKGLLFEEKTMKHDVSDESIRRALDIEIAALGHDPVTCDDGEVQAKARTKALANLSKDPLHYYNLLAKESSKVDKNDKMKETKRGALEKDTFNDMKKATLKEIKQNLVEGTRALVGYLSGDRLTTTYNHYDGYPSNLGAGLQAHYNDDDKAKEVAMKGYITYLNPETGEIESTHNEAPGKVILPDDSEQRAREIGEEIDKFGADYGYVWDDNSNQWITIKNTGIRSMIDQILDKLDMVNVHSGETMEDVDEVDSSLDPYEDKKAIIQQVIDLLKTEKGAGNEVIKDFIKTHYEDIINLGDDQAILDEFEEFLSVNTDYVDETDAYDNDEETQDMIDQMRKDGKDADDFVDEKKLNEEGAEDANYKMGEAFKRYGIDLSRDVIVAEMDGGTAGMGGGQVDIGPPEPAMLVAKRLERHRLDTILDYESEDQMRDFPVMYEDGFYGDYTPEGTEHKLTYSEDEGTMWDIFQAPSGVSEKKGEGLKDVEDGRDIGGKIIEFAGGGMVDINIDYQRGKTKYFKDVPVEKAIDIVNQYIEQNDLTQASTYGTKRVLQVDDGDTAIDITRAGMSEKKGKDHDQEIISYIADTYIQNAKGGDKAYAEFRDLNIRDAVQDVVGILQDPKHPLHGETKKEYRIVSRDKARGLFEKKGKDHDGDGDIDGDDYKSAKDKAIKKAMGKKSKVNEAVKNIITKVLEEQLVNEAATNDLAKIASEYEGFEGLKPAVVALENIVTEIESFYDKTRGKIQKIYNDLGEVRNEEGLKVGAFIAPSIENAFKRDLRPITKNQFHGGLDMPKVKRISQDDIDRGYIQQESPKQTVYTPVNEKK